MTEAFDLAGFLRTHGVAAEIVDAAIEEGGDALRALARSVVILGEAPSLTPREVWQRAGADEVFGRKMWRAMGFPQIPDDDPALTQADVDALAIATAYLRVTGVGDERAVRFTRLLGQSMSRIADAVLSIGFEGVDEIDLDGLDRDELLLVAGDLVNQLIERELGYLLRRHLHAAITRRFEADVPDGAADLAVGPDVVAVGFADLVSFTRLSGELSEASLADLLERFESITADEISERGGRVVKLIGDEVLFTFTDPVAAADAAMALVDHFGGDLPELRIGLTLGPVISRLGDVFGPTVNLASRLVAFARPGTVLVDDALTEALDGVEHLEVRSLRPRELKGLGLTAMHALRSTMDEPEVRRGRRDRTRTRDRDSPS